MFTTKNTDVENASTSATTNWSAVGSMSMCVALLIAAEFMPVSLLTPIASDLHASVGMAGQAISVSGLFAVITCLYIATFAARYDRNHVLIGLTGLMILSLVPIALAPNFLILMVARAMLGVVIGGFWALATATVMRLVPEDMIPQALGAVYRGNALAVAFAAPIGSYIGGIIGWRGVFWGLVPLGAITMTWQRISLPSNTPSSCHSREQTLRTFEETKRGLCHGRGDAHVCRGLRYLHVSTAVPGPQDARHLSGVIAAWAWLGGFRGDNAIVV